MMKRVLYTNEHSSVERLLSFFLFCEVDINKRKYAGELFGEHRGVNPEARSGIRTRDLCVAARCGAPSATAHARCIMVPNNMVLNITVSVNMSPDIRFLDNRVCNGYR